MRSRRRIVSALIGLALIVPLAIWAGRGDEPAEVAVAGASSGPARSIGSAVADIPREELAARSEPPVPAATEPATYVVSVSGRCVNAQGLPIDGAEVACSALTWIPEGIRRIDGVYAKDSPDDPLFRAVLTGADGRFRISLAPRASNSRTFVEVAAQAQGTARLRATAFVAPGGSEDVGDLVLHQGVRIAGFVRDVQGSSCANVRVWVVAGARGARGEHREETRTAADGSFSIERVLPVAVPLRRTNAFDWPGERPVGARRARSSRSPTARSNSRAPPRDAAR
jgi:hypothetical protein